MLIGKENAINVKLVEEVSKVFPITFVDYQDILENQDHLLSYNPKIVMLNLMDIGMDESSILRMVKERYPAKKIIALHCFQVEFIIQATLDRGYDHYISILNFSEEFQMLLDDKPEIFQG